MSRFLSEPSANVARRPRRSLVEFTVPITSSAVLETLRTVRAIPLVRPLPGTMRVKDPRPKVVARRKFTAPDPIVRTENVAVSVLPPTKSRRAEKPDGNAGNGISTVVAKRTKGASASKLMKKDSAAVTAADLYVKAFGLLEANVNATLEYARRLGEVKSPAQFIELSASHVRKQFDLLVAQAAKVRTLLNR